MEIPVQGKRMISRISLLAISLLSLAANLNGQKPGAERSAIDPAKLDTGARIYASLCTTCHGPDGAAIGGVDLRRGQYRRAQSDLDLMNTILHGVPGTAMPANA